MLSTLLQIKHSFALRLSLYTITCVIIIFVGVLIYNYQVSKLLILENSYKNVQSLASATLNNIDALLIAAQKVPEDLASFIEYSDQPKAKFLEMLRSIVETNPEIYGSTVSFEPYMFDRSTKYFAPYYYKSPKGIKYLNLASSAYDYMKWEWYTLPIKLGRPVWSEPFFDQGGVNIYLVTYSQPVYKQIDFKRVLCAIATCDIALDWLVDMIGKIKIYDTGYAFILSSNGKFIAHPNKEYYEKDFSYYDLADKYNDTEAKIICEDMTSGKTGFTKYLSHNRNEYCYIYYQPLKETGWSLGIVIPEGELYSKLQKTTLELLLIGIVGYLLTLVLVVILSSIATNPLKSLAKATLRIGNGDFNVEIPKAIRNDEIGALSGSFITMQNNLIKYITDLKYTTTAKERIERELSIARELQQSILPHDFPIAKEFEIYAALLPAREVGGDLYDFFFIDDENLCFAIGDVSGKGVPAALFMAITKTLIRAKVDLKIKLGEVVNQMNRAFSKENDSCMFVTFIICILNIRTGTLQYCNAGHNPPAIGTKDANYAYLSSEDPLPPIGIIDDISYTENEFQLKQGDTIFLYTDGITEAMSKESVQFSDENLLVYLNENKNKSLKLIADNLLDGIRKHADGAEQSDDITLLVLKYKG